MQKGVRLEHLSLPVPGGLPAVLPGVLNRSQQNPCYRRIVVLHAPYWASDSFQNLSFACCENVLVLRGPRPDL